MSDVSQPVESSLSNYVDTCVTLAKTIRWLAFALCLCSGSLLLLIVTHYHGNLTYVIERRKEIQRQCFNAPPADGTPEYEQCQKFINDLWEHDLKYVPLPSNLSDDEKSKLKTLSEPDRKQLLVEFKNKETIDSVSKLQSEMRVIELPLINIKLLYTDFAPILILLGLFFLYWLRLSLEFARNTLCNLYNDFSTGNQAIRTIPAHFLLLWTGGSRRRSHWAFWAILYSIIVSGLILVVTDYSDFFRTGANHSVSINQQAGWRAYLLYAYGKMAIELILMLVAGYIIYRSHNIIRDVRNLLMLIEWDYRALRPLLYHLFANEKSPLLKGANETSYDEYGTNVFCLRIRLTFPRDAADPKPDDSFEECFFACVDLWKSASHKNSYAHPSDLTRLFSEDELAHSSSEERRMRCFFFNLLTNPNIERELCFEFWKVGRSRNLHGKWMEKCEEEFNEENNRPRATTHEMITRTEPCGKIAAH